MHGPTGYLQFPEFIPGHAGIKNKERADSLASKTTVKDVRVVVRVNI